MRYDGYFEALQQQRREAGLAEMRRTAAQAILLLYSVGGMVDARQGIASYRKHAAPLREDAGPATIIAMTRSQ